MNFKNYILPILFALSSLLGYSQAPESMNYQAIIRYGSGELVTSQQVGLRIKILQGSAKEVVYMKKRICLRAMRMAL